MAEPVAGLVAVVGAMEAAAVVVVKAASTARMASRAEAVENWPRVGRINADLPSPRNLSSCLFEA